MWSFLTAMNSFLKQRMVDIYILVLIQTINHCIGVGYDGIITKSDTQKYSRYKESSTIEKVPAKFLSLFEKVVNLNWFIKQPGKERGGNNFTCFRPKVWSYSWPFCTIPRIQSLFACRSLPARSDRCCDMPWILCLDHCGLSSRSYTGTGGYIFIVTRRMRLHKTTYSFIA